MTVLNDKLEPLTGEHVIAETRLDMRKVEQLVREGVWGKEELDRYGLVIPEPFVVPEGKDRTGEPAYVRDGDTVREVYETRDRPPPPPEPTPVERLAEIGLTPADLVAMIDAERERAKVDAPVR